MTVVLLAAATQALASTPEGACAASGTSFSSLGGFKFERAAAPAVPSKPAGKPVKAKSVEFVNVSGSVSMNGSGNVMRGQSYVWVNLSGNAAVSDSSGRVTSNYTWFNRNVGCSVNNGWVNCNDWPQWQVQFYKDGRYVGTGTVSGSINASAYAPNGFFTINTFVNLSGSVTVSD